MAFRLLRVLDARRAPEIVRVVELEPAIPAGDEARELIHAPHFDAGVVKRRFHTRASEAEDGDALRHALQALAFALLARWHVRIDAIGAHHELAVLRVHGDRLD